MNVNALQTKRGNANRFQRRENYLGNAITLPEIILQDDAQLSLEIAITAIKRAILQFAVDPSKFGSLKR